jgi:hypothetical protein
MKILIVPTTQPMLRRKRTTSPPTSVPNPPVGLNVSSTLASGVSGMKKGVDSRRCPTDGVGDEGDAMRFEMTVEQRRALCAFIPSPWCLGAEPNPVEHPPTLLSAVPVCS